MAELRQAFERSDAQVGADDVPAAPRRSRMRLDPPLVCVFTASPVIAAPVRPVTAAPVETSPRPRRSWPRIDPAQAFAMAETEIARGWDRFAGRIESFLADRAAANRPQSPTFEPIDPARAVSTSLADELNRTSEGIAIAWPGIEDSRSPASGSGKSSVRSTAIEGRRPSSAGPSPEVAQAMRLTRDAVHAWVKVMAGPASIQVSAR